MAGGLLRDKDPKKCRDHLLGLFNFYLSIKNWKLFLSAKLQFDDLSFGLDLQHSLETHWRSLPTSLQAPETKLYPVSYLQGLLLNFNSLSLITFFGFFENLSSV